MEPQNSQPELPDNRPEQQPAAARQAPAQTAVPAGKEEDAQSRDFNKAVQEKTKKYEEKVEELEKQYKSRWSIAETKQMRITDQQINELRRAAEAKKEAFSRLTKDMKAQRFGLMLQETEQDLSGLYLPYQEIVHYVRGLDKLDESELVKLEAFLKALNKMKTNPDLKKLFLKGMNREKFDQKELNYLVGMINPVNLRECLDQQKTDAVFEASQVGAVISVMEPGQKLELVKLLIEHKAPQDYKQILDIFLITGQLSNMQLLHLLDGGRIPEPYAREYRERLEQGKIRQEQEEYLKKYDDLSKVNMGRTPQNALSKSFGKPGLFGAASLWGAVVSLVNFQIDFDPKDISGSMGKILGNEYFLAGLAAMGVGVAGTLSVVAPNVYAKYKDKIGNFFSGPEEKKAKNTAMETDLKAFLDLNLQRNPYFTSFLIEKEDQKGQTRSGLDIIKEITTERRNAQKEVRFEFEDIKARCGTRQARLLEKAYGLEGRKPVNLNQTVRNVMGSLYEFGKDNTAAVEKVVTDLRVSQGVK
jgi:hypothetical protein